MDEFKIAATYEDALGEVKTVRSTLYLKKGETRQKAVMDVVKNGMQIEVRDLRGIYDFIPPHRLVKVRYAS